MQYIEMLVWVKIQQNVLSSWYIINDPQSTMYSLEDMKRNKYDISAQKGKRSVENIKQNMLGKYMM